MTRVVGLVAIIITAAGSSRDARADLVYSLLPYTVDAGISVDSGSITVTETAAEDMLLDKDEIVSFSVDVTDEVGSFTFTGTGANAVINGPIAIGPASIFVPFPVNLRDENLMLLEDPGSNAHAQWLAINLGSDLSSVTLNSRTGVLHKTSVSAPIGVAVPEPKSMIFLVIGGVFLRPWRRMRVRAKRESSSELESSPDGKLIDKVADVSIVA